MKMLRGRADEIEGERRMGTGPWGNNNNHYGQVVGNNNYGGYNSRMNEGVITEPPPAYSNDPGVQGGKHGEVRGMFG